MNAWRRPRTTARVARLLLFIWPFAIVATWANACLLETRGDHARETLARVAAVASSAADAASDADHGDTDLAACLDRCDDGQRGIPKNTVTSAPDLVATTMMACAPWSFAAIEPTVLHEHRLAVAPPPERPVAIRFLRLTI